MLKILLDSSDKNFSVFLFNETWELEEHTFKNIEGKHSEKDLELLFEFFNKNKIYPQNLSHFIVNKGNGSYTGLRIAATIAKMFKLGKKEIIICTIKNEHINEIKNQKKLNPLLLSDSMELVYE